MDRRAVKVLANTFCTALIAWFLIYFALRHKPWGTDFAVCVGYTILAAGVIYADKDSSIFSPKTRPPLILIVVQHACFLIVAIVLFRAIASIEPALDTISLPKENWGIAVPALSMFGLAYGEKWLLSRNSNQRSGTDDEDSLVDSSSAERDQDR